MANEEFNRELIEKAKAAKSPEELPAIARENGIADFTEADAQACFQQNSKTDELSDDALAQAAGGGSSGQKIIQPFGTCPEWKGPSMTKVCVKCIYYSYVHPNSVCRLS